MQSRCHHKDRADGLKKRIVFAARPRAARKIPHHRKARKILVMRKDFFDLTSFIRSIQRREGNPDCFGKAQGYCDRLDCAWRRYCLEKPQEKTTVYKNEGNVV